MEMAPQELYRMFRDVGFGRNTGVELPGEQAGTLPNRKHWRASEHASLAYGYGVAVTPLQLARAYGILAADGVMLPSVFANGNDRLREIRCFRLML